MFKKKINPLWVDLAPKTRGCFDPVTQQLFKKGVKTTHCYMMTLTKYFPVLGKFSTH